MHNKKIFYNFIIKVKILYFNKFEQYYNEN